ncbi:hypothetical protein BGZ58_003802 [Dissophora ornata]|nr:hypothetical protein BGZ58_003802 [Dissophora ornata]
MSDGSKILHEIHLAKHEGYDIDKPTEFFQRYGPYLLTMMLMVKSGIAAAGIIVPPLANFRLAEGIEAVQKTLGASKHSISSLADETITYIEDQNSKTDIEEDTAVSSIEHEKLELDSYPKIKDESRVLANIYRTVTTEGHVKWVCIDHYRENYRESMIKQLRDIVAANNGVFIEETGEVDIHIETNTLARQFYDALGKARGIQRLDIGLGWDMTLDDLRKLAVAITNATIPNVITYGAFFDGPALDLANAGRRFDPIAQLICKGHIKSLRIINYNKFFRRVSSSFTSIASQLRVLELVVGPEDHDVVRPTLSRALERCPSLIDLTLHYRDACSAYEVVMDKIGFMKQLRTLNLGGEKEPFPIWVTISQGKAVDITCLDRLVNSMLPSTLWSDGRKFFSKGLLARMKLAFMPPPEQEYVLAYILKWNPLIADNQIACLAKNSAAAILLVTATREQELKQGKTWALRKLEVIDNEQLRAKVEYDDIITSTVEVQEHSTTTNISTSVTMDAGGPQRKSSFMDNFFLQFRWSIEMLDTD